MAQIDDLNAAIAAEDVEVQTLLASVTKIGSDIDALLAKIAAGGVPTDLTAQLSSDSIACSKFDHGDPTTKGCGYKSKSTDLTGH